MISNTKEKYPDLETITQLISMEANIYYRISKATELESFTKIKLFQKKFPKTFQVQDLIEHQAISDTLK